MSRRCKYAIVQTKALREPVIFVSPIAARRRGIDHLVEIWVRDVDFPGRDSDYGSVFFVQGDDFEGILAAEPEVIVCFVTVLCK